MKAFKPYQSNIKKYLTFLVAGLAAVTTPALLAQGCFRGSGVKKEGCSAGMGGMSCHEPGGQASAAVAKSSSKPVFMQPLQSVFDSYISIQGTLVQDSLKGVARTAAAMARAMRGDSRQMLSPKVAEQAEALAQAKDLATARSAYKALSDSLIRYVKAQKLPPGTYYEAYCPMAKASWLQTQRSIQNPTWRRRWSIAG